MCRASNEPGGAKRCAAHTRASLEKATKALDTATNKYIELTSIKKVMGDIDNHPGFIYNLRNKRLVTKLSQRLYDNEEEQQALVESYMNARKEYNLMVRGLNEEVMHADLYAHNDFAGREKAEADREEALRKNVFSGFFFDEFSSTLDDKKVTEAYLDAKKKQAEAEAEYLGTTEGISAHLMDDSNYDNRGMPKDELAKKLAIFSKESRNRESSRRVEMERVRLHAKATTRPADWDEYKKWQDAWDRDPTLINNDSFYVAEHSENRVVLTASMQPATVVYRWGIELTRNPDTGKISQKVVRPER